MQDSEMIEGPAREELIGKASISAAKLHVLGLTPLKARLGPRWDRLSALVHRLVEKAIHSAQGPADHCIVLDELSYAVTFNNLTLTEASHVCAAIAREVCEHLFGDQIDEVSVRSIIAEIASLGSMDIRDLGRNIESQVETRGVENIITHSLDSGSPDPVVIVSGARPRASQEPSDRIQAIHTHLAPFGLKIGLLPIWDLQRGISNCLFVTLFSGETMGVVSSGKLMRCGASDAQALEIEIDQLVAASSLCDELQFSGKVCAVGVGVSYNSLNSFRMRIRYLSALQKLGFHSKNPLLLKIEQIPEGAPEGRISELLSMLSAKNVRFTLEFQNLSAVSSVVFRPGPIGVGGAIPSSMDLEMASVICRKLASYASAHKIFAFMDHLESRERIQLAKQEGIRFGMGTALTKKVMEIGKPDLLFPLIIEDHLAG